MRRARASLADPAAAAPRRRHDVPWRSSPRRSSDHGGPSGTTATAPQADEVRAPRRVRPDAGRAARARPALPAGRGRVRGAPRDGDHARRRARAAAPAPTCSIGRDARRRRRRRRPARARARLGRRRDRTPSSPHYRALCHAERSRRPSVCRSRHGCTPTAVDALDTAGAADAQLANATDRAARRRRRRFAGPGVDVPDAALRALASICEVDHRAAPASPRRAATGGRWRCTGRSPARCRARRRRRAARRSTDEVVRGRAGLQRRAACRSPPRPAAAACAAPRPRCSAAWCSTCTALAGVVDDRRRSPARRRAARHVRTRPRGRAARRHGLTVGHCPQSFDLSTVGGWLACAWRRPVLDPLRQDRGHGGRPRGRARRRHRRAHRRRARGSGGPRPHPAVRRLRGHPRRHHRGAAAPAPDPRRTSDVRPTRSPRSPTASRPAGASCARGAHARRAAPLRRGRVAARPGRRRQRVHPARARRGRPRDRRRHHGDRRRRSAPTSAPSGSTSTWSRRGSGTATTSRRWRRSPARGSSSTRWRSPPRGRPARRAVRRRPRGDAGRARTPVRRRATSRTATPTAPVSTSPSPATPPADEIESTLRRAVGRRAASRCSPTAATCRTTTGSA